MPPTAAYDLIEADGTQKLVWAPGGTRRDPSGTIASEGPGRSARRVHERTPRAYQMKLAQMSGAEVTVLTEMLAATRGTGLVAWRHPTDDTPGGPTGAPLWMVSGAREALAVTRNKGSVSAGAELVFEEV